MHSDFWHWHFIISVECQDIPSISFQEKLWCHLSVLLNMVLDVGLAPRLHKWYFALYLSHMFADFLIAQIPGAMHIYRWTVAAARCNLTRFVVAFVSWPPNDLSAPTYASGLDERGVVDSNVWYYVHLLNLTLLHDFRTCAVWECTWVGLGLTRADISSSFCVI